VRYADSAGGGTEGLILYYYGVRLDRASLMDNAQQWLKQVKSEIAPAFEVGPALWCGGLRGIG